MAKKINLADLVFKISDDGTLKVFQGEAKKAGKAVGGVGKETDKTTYATKKGINATANQTKNFSNMARGISGGLVPAYATLAANVFALTAVFGFLKGAADYRLLQEGQAAYAGVTGIAYKSLTNTIIDATDAQIKYSDAAQAAAIGTAAGLSPAQLEKLGAAAKTVSIALGRDVTDSFNRLIRGTTKAEPELLDELGIILRLDTATRAYADALGVSKESLNAFQRTQAVTNDVLGQVENKFNAINAIVDPQSNQINKLAKAFDDLTNSLRTLIAGPAEGLATFFSNNVLAAAGALGIFVLPIIRSILPAFDEMAERAQAKMAVHNEALEGAKTAMNQYRDTSLQAQKQAERTFNTLQTKAQGLAGNTPGMPKGRAGSGMRNLQEGKTITSRQAAAIKKQVTNTESIYFISNAKIRRNWVKTMDAMVVADKVKNGKLKVQAKSLELTLKASFASIKVAWKATMVGMQSAATKAGKIMSKAFGFLTFISIGFLVFDAVKAGAQKLGLFGNGADDAADSIDNLVKRQKELNDELDKMFGDRKKLKEINAPFEMMVKNAGNLFQSAAFTDDITKLAELNEKIAELDVRDVVKTAVAGKADHRTTDASPNSYITGQGKNIAVRQDDGTFNKRSKLTEDEKTFIRLTEKATQFKIAVGTTVKKFGAEFPEMMASVNQETGEFIGTLREGEDGKLTLGLVDGVGSFLSVLQAGGQAQKDLETGAGKFGQSINREFGKATSKVQLLRDALLRTKDNAAVLASMLLTNKSNKAAGLDASYSEEDITTKKGQLNEATSFSDSMQASVNADRLLVTEKARFALEKEQLTNRIYGGTKLAAMQQTRIAMKLRQSEIDQLEVEIAHRLLNIKEGDEEKNLQEIQDMQNKAATLGQLNIGLANSVNLTRELGVVAIESFENGMTKGIQGMIEGTMSLQDAFKSMAKGILQSLAQVLAKMMAMKIMGGMFGITPMATGGIIPMAKGGITGYRNGGVATEPTYLVGEGKHNEAVVPLPDGRSIPVNMSGGGGSNNVVINVDASGSTSSTGSGEQGKALGIAIQAAVMETIQREKRPGGVLSRS